MDTGERLNLIRGLCSLGPRRAGGDAERRAAALVAERLRGLGRPAEVEPTTVHPQYGYVLAAHCLLGIAGSLVAVEAPVVGFALVLVAATSFYLDLEHRAYLIRRLFFRRGSQNVVSVPAGSGEPTRVIVCAHTDAARGGAVFSPRFAGLAAALRTRLPWLAPLRILFWSLALLLPILGARMAGADSAALSALALPPTLALLVGAFALVEIELSPVGPGANDNASGVAAALSLAAELEAQPARNVEVWFLLDGGEEPIQEGMRAFLRSHRERLDRERTFFLVLDTVGAGEPRFVTASGWVTSFGADRRLLELCAAIAEASGEGDVRPRPLRRGVGDDATAAAVAGYPSLAITCLPRDGRLPGHRLAAETPDALEPEAIEGARALALELIRRLDRDAGRAKPAPAAKQATG